MSQDELIDAVWREIINRGMDGAWIAKLSADSKKRPDGPFADVGLVLDEMLAKGVSREDICRLARLVRYEACFDLLYRLEQDPLPSDEFEGIHESLLSTDPSGLEGRPGSWPIPRQKASRRKRKPPSATAPILAVKRSFSFAFSPNGKSVAAAGGGEIWDVGSGKQLAKCNLYPNTTRMQFSPDGRRLAAINTSGVVAVFDASSGTRLFACKTGSEGDIVLYSPDGQYLMAANWAGKLYVWHADDGKSQLVHDFDRAKIDSVSFVENGSCLIAIRPTGMATRYQLSVWNANLSIEQSRTRLNPPCRELWLEPRKGGLALMNTREQSWLCKLPSEESIAEVPGLAPRDAAFSPDGEFVAVVVEDEFVLLSVPNLQVVMRYPCKYANHVAFSQDGQLIGLATWRKGEIWKLSDLLQLNQS